MSIKHLCDHHAVVYRATALNDEFNDTVLFWSALPAPAGLNARATLTEAGNLIDHGPGEIQNAMQRWFLLPSFDVKERDVLSVETGPRAPQLYRVEKVIPGTHPLIVHHIEVDLSVWAGSITEEPVSSS